MISITKVQVPSYLAGSEFYNSLDGDDCEVFNIPVENLKPNLTVNCVQDVAYLLRTLQYWGVYSVPRELVAFMIYKHTPEFSEDVRQSMSQFSTHSKLLDSYITLQALHSCNRLSNGAWGVLTELDAVAILMDDLFSSGEAVSEKAEKVLETIVNTDKEPRDHILHLLNTSCEEINRATPICVVQNCARVYSTAFEAAKTQEWRRLTPDDLVFSALPVLTCLLYWDDTNTVEHSTSALYSVMSASEEHMWAVYEEGVLPRLVQLLTSASASTQTTALLSVGEFAFAYGHPVTHMIECGVLPVLKSLLTSAVSGLANNTCWVLCNIVIDSKEAFQAVIDAGVIDRVLELQRNDVLAARLHLSWLLHDGVTVADCAQIVYLVNAGVVLGINTLLLDSSQQVSRCALECLCALLDKCESYCSTDGMVRGVVAQLIGGGGLVVVQRLSGSKWLRVRASAEKILMCCHRFI